MGKKIRDYVKYTQSELENYTKIRGTCVQKINKNIHINFPPYGLGSIKSTLLHIISEKKIGSYDYELKGIILDVRNIKILGNLAAIRFDDPALHIDIQADCYVFNPKIGSIVRGLVKHIAAHQISVIIYRVFNVSIRLSLKERYDNTSIELNSEIEFRIKNFDLENLMPYIEGELVAKEMPLKYIEYNSNNESNEEDEQSECKDVVKVKRIRKKSTLMLPPTEDTDDEEIVFSEIFHLKTEEINNENGIKKVKRESDIILNNSDNIKNKKARNVLESKKVTAAVKRKNTTQSSSSTEDSDSNNETSESNTKKQYMRDEIKLENSPNTNKILHQKVLTKTSTELNNSNSSDNEIKLKNFKSENEQNSDREMKSLDNSENSSSEEEIEFKNAVTEIKIEKNIHSSEASSSDDDIELENIGSEITNSEIGENVDDSAKLIKSETNKNNYETQTKSLKEFTIMKSSDNSENSSSEEEIEFKNAVTEIKIEKNIHSSEASSSDDDIELENIGSEITNSEIGENVDDSTKLIKSETNKNNYETQTKSLKEFTNTGIPSSPESLNKLSSSIKSKSYKLIEYDIEPNNMNSENIDSRNLNDNESEDIFDGNSTQELSLGQQQRIKNKSSKSKVDKKSKKVKTNMVSANKVDTDSGVNISTEVVIKTEAPLTIKKKIKRTASKDSLNNYSNDIESTIKTEKEFVNKTPVKIINGDERYKTISTSSSTNCSISGASSNKFISPKKLVSSTDTNTLTGSINNITSRVFSNKTESAKKEIVFDSPLANKKRNKVKSVTSESSSLEDSMADIMSRVMSNKIKSPKKTNKSDSPKTEIVSKSLLTKEVSKKLATSESNSVDNLITGIMARVLAKKLEAGRYTSASESSSIIASKNRIKSSRKSISTETKPTKKTRKSVNFTYEPENKIAEHTTNNNEIEMNSSDSFSVPLLSSTKIESVKKKKKIRNEN